MIRIISPYEFNPPILTILALYFLPRKGELRFLIAKNFFRMRVKDSRMGYI
jgi:hypothetical protein